MESHLIKLLPNKEYVVEILEEIIEFKEDEKKVLNYVVLVEQAQRDLRGIVKTWADEKASVEGQEVFSVEKLFYIFFKAMQALEYLHSENVYYGDMKEANLLIFRDY
jgi:serine/threonine protein kinase